MEKAAWLNVLISSTPDTCAATCPKAAMVNNCLANAAIRNNLSEPNVRYLHAEFFADRCDGPLQKEGDSPCKPDYTCRHPKTAKWLTDQCLELLDSLKGTRP